MCLYPRIIRNPRYTENIKNGGVIPAVQDARTLRSPIGCGNCIECMNQKRRDWHVRLNEEIKNDPRGKFITLTFSNESISNIAYKFPTLNGYNMDNAIATFGARHWLEKHRDETGKSIKHWLVSELGHNGTENIHLHGIIWTDTPIEEIQQMWRHGFMWKGQGEKQINYVNGRTVGYITKYVTKTDIMHPHYKPVTLTSAGIGAAYINERTKYIHKYIPGKTIEYYKMNNGHKVGLPMYYRNKLWTDEEREMLWIEKLNKEIRYVKGEKTHNYKEYFGLQKYWQERNKQLGYGDYNINWNKKDYETQLRELKLAERILAGINI